MPRTSSPAVPHHEVRHFQPDDCLHYEPISVRGQLHQWAIPTHRHEALHQFQLLAGGGRGCCGPAPAAARVRRRRRRATPR